MQTEGFGGGGGSLYEGGGGGGYHGGKAPNTNQYTTNYPHYGAVPITRELTKVILRE